jgi:hypothetical protein
MTVDEYLKANQRHIVASLIENHNSEHAGKKKENFHSSIDSQTAG